MALGIGRDLPAQSVLRSRASTGNVNECYGDPTQTEVTGYAEDRSLTLMTPKTTVALGKSLA